MFKFEIGNTFGSRQRKSKISLHLDALKKFEEGFEKAFNIEDNIAIVVDTNVLIRYYKISFEARAKLLNFLDDNKQRIFLTSQIEQEFTSNRRKNIEKYFQEVTKEVPRNFAKNILNPISHFINGNEAILRDYPSVNDKLKVLLRKSNEIEQELIEGNGVKYSEAQKLIFNDPFLELLNDLKKIDRLSEDEILLLSREFDELRKGLKPENVAKFIEKEKDIFPGIGDVKEKPLNPYGDYIIFHELLKFTKERECNVVFLTYDANKGDWLRKSKMPHLEYIECTYDISSKFIYILDAEPFFKEKLSADFASLVEDKHNGTIEFITLESLNRFLKSFTLYSDLPKIKNNDVSYHVLNEILSVHTILSELESDLRSVFNLAMEYRESKGNRLNKLGMMRVSLSIIYPQFSEKEHFERNYLEYHDRYYKRP